MMYHSLIVAFCTTILLASCSKAQSTADPSSEISTEIVTPETVDAEQRLLQKSTELKSYLTSNKQYNQKLAICIDMRIPSNRYRFFLVDLDSMKVLKKGLVAHGSGSETGTPDSLRFSNIPNSYCSSLGTYKIGAAYIGSFGRSYKLHGLDPTNNKAFDRAVVFHRYMCVPDEEQPEPICNSLGCPMVSERFFEEIDAVLKSSSKPILMEIYY